MLSLGRFCLLILCSLVSLPSVVSVGMVDWGVSFDVLSGDGFGISSMLLV